MVIMRALAIVMGGVLQLSLNGYCAEDAFRGADFATESAWSIILSGTPSGGTVTLALASDPSRRATVKTAAGESLAVISQNLASALQSIKGNGFSRAQYLQDSSEIVLYNSTQGELVLRSTDSGIVTFEAVSNLAASTSLSPATVTLQWNLPASGFDNVVVMMYGEQVVRLPGTATQATHPAPGNAHTLTLPVHRAVIDFTVVGIKNGIPSDSATVAVVNPIPPAELDVATPSLPAATKGAAYLQSLAKVAGTAPYTWSIAEGTIPDGLSLSTSGEISGTPSKVGVFSFTVQVTDAYESSAKRKLTLKVSE